VQRESRAKRKRDHQPAQPCHLFPRAQSARLWQRQSIAAIAAATTGSGSRRSDPNPPCSSSA
jgi:hypothetical protein